MKKLLSVLLAVLMAAPLLTACGENAENSDQSGNAGAQNTAASQTAEEQAPEETEITRANYPDTLPDDLDFAGTQLDIFTFGSDNCQKYDALGELNGDVVLDAVYNRNITVEDRLNVKFNFVAGSADWGGFPGEVTQILQAGTDDYDLIMEESSQLFSQSIQGYYYDWLTLDNVNLEQPWWYSDLMEESQLDNSKRFFLDGDICLTVFFGASALYYNKPVFIDYFGDTNQLYDSVLDGSWTYDKFADYCRQVYTDTNGNGEADDGDIMGFRFEQWGIPNYMSMSTGLNYAVRDDEGFPSLDIYNDNGIRWGETLYRLLYTDNISMLGSKQDTFIQGKSLFYPGMFDTAMALRDVDFDYGILPYPKLDESLDYLCGAATANGCGVAIPVSANKSKMSATTAAVEALCAESYRRVVPAWYDTALKIKYSNANIDSQMVDIIYDHINSPFIMMADKALGTGSIYTNAVFGSSNEGAFASWWAKNEKLLVKKLDKAIESYKNLP
jgi:disulfide oxidoreductase YuzD